MKGEPGVRYCKTIEEQLDLWVVGDSRHNQVADMCTPDFSCCRPSLLWPKAQRDIFVRACNERNEAVLDMFLEKAIHDLVSSSLPDNSTVYINGKMPEGDDEIH